LRHLTTCLLLLLPLSWGCRSLQKSSESAGSNNSPTWSSDKNGILFIHLSVHGEQVGEPQLIGLIDAQIMDGRIKAGHPTEHIDPAYQIVAQIIDCEGTVRQAEFFPNPLLKNIEFVNEEERFERKIIALDTEEMFIRLQILPDDCKVKLGIQIGDSPGLLSTVAIDLLTTNYLDN